MKQLIIAGDVKDVNQIIKRLSLSYPNKTVEQYLDSRHKQREVLV